MMADAAPPTEPASSFAAPGWKGLANPGLGEVDPQEVVRVADPSNALSTIHWGRNYLYRTSLTTDSGTLQVAVKQFRHDRWLSRLDRRLRGTRAARAWRIAQYLGAHGVATPRPLLLLESNHLAGPAVFVTEYLPDAVEARYLIRALNQGRLEEEFPWLDAGDFVASLGRLARGIHTAGVLHRDYSVGNVVVQQRPDEKPPILSVLDLSRARHVERLGIFRRTRELTRLNLRRRGDQDRLLAVYWGVTATSLGWRGVLFRLLETSFQAKQPLKRRLRAPLRWVKKLTPRTTHPHIPPAAGGRGPREKSVWDALSDQPHQHADRLERLGQRLGQIGTHVREARLAVRRWHRAAPIRRRLREHPPLPFRLTGFGVGVRPVPEGPEPLLKEIESLGLRRVLLRLHLWEEERSPEAELAAALHEAGFETTFVLAQDRSLVRDRSLWEARVEEVAERFLSWGEQFQIGQAVNRSKWGYWSLGEYAQMASAAAETLRRHGDVTLLGPAIIDFEPLALATALEHPESPEFDAVAALLYVDRRGAPENRQLGFDAAEKARLFAALGRAEEEPSRRPLWITEFNWPLREGPHAPAGRDVAVDEETQADWLVRYLLETASTGVVERCYWWQLVAKGYGLIDPTAVEGCSRRPAFHALAWLERELMGGRLMRSLPSQPDARLLLLERSDGRPLVAGWSVRESVEAELPGAVSGWSERGGQEVAADGERVVALLPSPRLFSLEESPIDESP